MTTDLWMLVAAAGLQWVLIVIPTLVSIQANGVSWAAGNRDKPSAKSPAWAERAGRCSANMQENLAIFAILVLVTHVAGHHNSTTALGAEIFLGARVAHAIVYIAGVPFVRTACWVVSIVGMALIASALF